MTLPPQRLNLQNQPWSHYEKNSVVSCRLQSVPPFREATSTLSDSSSLLPKVKSWNDLRIPVASQDRTVPVHVLAISKCTRVSTTVDRRSRYSRRTHRHRSRDESCVPNPRPVNSSSVSREAECRRSGACGRKYVRQLPPMRIHSDTSSRLSSFFASPDACEGGMVLLV